MTKAILVYVSCADTGQAERLGELILKEKLGACVTVSGSVQSMFLWPPGKGLIDYATEVLLTVKTLDAKFPALESFILKHHTYENPEIIAVPVSHASKKYLEWMTGELP